TPSTVDTTGLSPLPATESPSPEESANGQDEAVAIDDLLDTTSASRAALNPAIDQVARCQDAAAGASTLDRITGERSDELQRAQDLRVDALPGGDELKSLLVESLQYSLQADQQ